VNRDEDNSDLLRKADALMRRHRPPTGEVRDRHDHRPEPSDDDVPVLTEVVTEDSIVLATAPDHMRHQLTALREELARWLSEELPQAVLKVTDGLADHLMEELTHQAEQQLLPRLISRLDGSDPVKNKRVRRDESF